MNFFRDVVSHLLKNAFEGHTQFSVADNTAVGDNPIRSISLDAVPVNESTMISLAWEGGEKVFEKTLSEQEAQHQFDLISTDLAEVASLTKQGQYDAAKDLMKKLGQKYAENTGELVQTNLPPLHNTQASEDDHILRQAKITMQNLWFSTTDELLDYQQKQKGATKPGDQDHVPLWDKAKGAKPPTDKLAPASLSYEDLEDKKEQEHEDMQQHIDDTIKTELESALQQKAASVFGPDEVELVRIMRKTGRNWDEIKKILTKDYSYDKDSVNIFIDEQRQGSDPAGIEVEPVKEDDKKESPLTPPEELVSPETHDQLLKDHEDKKKDNSPVEEPNFTPKEIMDIPEDEEIQDQSSLSNEIARADNDEIHKVATEAKCEHCNHARSYHTMGKTAKDKCKLCKCTDFYKEASLKTAGPSDLNPLQEPIEQEPTTPTQDVVPMGKKPLDHEAPQKGDRVFVASDMTDEKAGFEGTFISTYKSEGRDQYIVETDQGDLLDVDAHRVSKISENDGAQTAEPSMEPIIEAPQEAAIPVTPKMSDFHSASLDTEALAIKAELDDMLKIVKEAESHVIMPMMYGIDDDSILQYANGSIYADKIKSGQMQDADWQTLVKETGRWMTHVGRQKVSQTFPPEAEWFMDDEQVNKIKSMFNVLPKSSSLKKEAGTTWHDLGMPEPPQAGWKVKHSSGITGTVVDGNDKFANVMLDQPVTPEQFRDLDISDVQFQRGDHPKGVYAIYAGDGFGSWNGSVPGWTMMDSAGKPIYPKGYAPAAPAKPKVDPKKKLQQPPMEHDVNVETEPAIDTESAMVNWTCPKCGNAASASSVYDEKICMKDGCGTSMQKQAAEKCKCGHAHSGDVCDDCKCGIHHEASLAKQADQGQCGECGKKGYISVYKDKEGHEFDLCQEHYQQAREKKASVDKQAAPPVDPTKTQFKDYKITPKYTPKQEAVPATPEIDAVLSKMDALQQNLGTLEKARLEIQAKMQEEMTKVDQSGERVQMEAALQESIEKAAILINAVDSKVVQWKDKLYTLQTEEVQYVPKLSQKEMLGKIYEKFAGAEKYVKDVLNGMLSQAKSVTENTLVRWPNKKSSMNKEATILDDMNRYNEELMAALQALSSPI